MLAVSRANACGAVANTGKVAPLPVADSKELPKEFYETTFAFIIAPATKENGEARSTDAGIEQAVFALTTSLLSPSQFVVSYDQEPSVS